jgi:putative ABC transport system permease protein
VLIELAWRNRWRQPARTTLSLLTMAASATLLVSMLSFQFGVYDTMKSNALQLLDGYAQIQPAGYADDPDLRKTLDGADGLLAALKAVPGVDAVTTRASAYVVLARDELSFGAQVIGVDPMQEPRVSRVSATVREGRYLRAGDDDAIVLGDRLAKNLGLALGDRATLLGSARDGTVAADSLRVVGVFRTGVGEIDRQIAQVPLSRFQNSFGMDGEINVIAVGGRNLRAVNRALPALRQIAEERGMVVRNWGELEPALRQAVELDLTSAMLWYASLVVVVVFIILNTLLMSVLERTREFGVLLAIGMRADHIGRMLWLEQFFLAVLGNLAGMVVGAALSLWLGQRGIEIGAMNGALMQWGLPERLYPSLSPLSAFAGPGVILVSIALAGTIPLRRIARLEPVSAMRST